MSIKNPHTKAEVEKRKENSTFELHIDYWLFVSNTKCLNSDKVNWPHFTPKVIRQSEKLVKQKITILFEFFAFIIYFMCSCKNAYELA